MELNKANMKKLAGLIAFAVVFYMIIKNLYRFSDMLGVIGYVFAPILLGLVFAFILNVVMIQVETRMFSRLNRRLHKIWPKIRRPISLLVALILILGLIAVILLILVPEVVRTITGLTQQIPSFFNTLQGTLVQLGKRYPAVGDALGKVKIDWGSASQMLAVYGQKFAGSLLGSTVAVTTNVFHGAITLVLSFVIALNILMQKEKLKNQVQHVMRAYLPEKFNRGLLRLSTLVYLAFSNFIVGQCTEACILGTLCFIGMNIFRFPYALLVSVMVAFMALIPILGSFLSTVIGALLILIVSPIQAVWYVVFFVILQQLEGNLIFPHVVGSKVGLPALWVLFAVTIGGNLFGVVGMLVNIPICSVLYSLLREDVSRRLKREPKENDFKDLEENT